MGREAYLLHACVRVSLLNESTEIGLPSCHPFFGVLLLWISQVRLDRPGGISVVLGHREAVSSVKWGGHSPVLPAPCAPGQGRQAVL